MKNNIKNFFLIILSSILFWIIQNAILNYDPIIYQFNPIYLIIGIAIYLALLIFTSKKIIPKIEHIKYIHIVLFLIFGILSIVLGQLLKVNPSWDMGDVFNIAKNYTIGSEDIGAGYLLQYPNNQMITVIYIVVFKIASIFKCSDFITIATLFNSLIITATVILLYYCINKIYNKSKALLALIICLCTTPLYMHCAIYYTDSLSMFFSTLILFLFLILKENENKTTLKNILLIIMGIILAIAWKVKITSIFIAIAIVVYQILTKIDKKTLKNYCITGITAVVVLLGFSTIMNTQLNKSSNTGIYKMPIEHWIMMGLVDNGSYNEELLNYTLSYNSYSEKREADRLKINEIMRNYTCNDFIKHLTVKLKYAWTDGTYYAPAKLSRNPVNKNIIHECILNDGKYSNVYKYFPQVMHLTLLILIIFSCIKLIKEKDYTSYKYILSISMVGIIVFLLIWENRSRYILTMFPIYLALAIDGIDYIGEKSYLRAKGKNT